MQILLSSTSRVFRVISCNIPTIRTMTSNPEKLWDKACFLTRLVASSVKISEKAGEVIKNVMNKGDLKVVSKGVNDLQTEADRAAQYCIIQSLQKKFGEWLCVVGEEEKESVVHEYEDGFCTEVLEMDDKCVSNLRDITEKDVVVWVDPVDGTSEFAQGAKDGSGLIEQVTVLIGIGFHGKAIGGVIHQPYYGFSSLPVEQQGRTIWAFNGIKPQGINIRNIDTGKKTVVTTRSHSTTLVNDALESLANAGLADEVLRVGGAGYKVLKTLEGCHAYVFASPGCKKWDTCAPEAILTAAGGCLTDIHGNKILYHSDVQRKNSGGVLATAPGADHQAYIEAIPDQVKSALPSKL